MAENKTRETNASVSAFLAGIDESILEELIVKSVEAMRARHDTD